MDNMRGFWNGSTAALLLAWCVCWPVVLAWASLESNLIISVIAIVVLVLTPSVIYMRQARLRLDVLRDLDDERTRHRACHEVFDERTTMHRFHMHEAIAHELEVLGDELAAAPPRMLVDPHRVAALIERRVARLRQSAPDPPSSLFQSLIDGNAKSEISTTDPTEP